jgi:putative flippase GtrA
MPNIVLIIHRNFNKPVHIPMLSFFFKIPEKIRMILIAVIGGIIGWITYECIYWLNPLHSCRASSSWLLEFMIGTARQHAMHRWFTFRHTGSYWGSLLKAYLYYSVTACLGTGINYFPYRTASYLSPHCLDCLSFYNRCNQSFCSEENRLQSYVRNERNAL